MLLVIAGAAVMAHALQGAARRRCSLRLLLCTGIVLAPPRIPGTPALAHLSSEPTSFIYLIGKMAEEDACFWANSKQVIE